MGADWLSPYVSQRVARGRCARPTCIRQSVTDCSTELMMLSFTDKNSGTTISNSHCNYDFWLPFLLSYLRHQTVWPSALAYTALALVSAISSARARTGLCVSVCSCAHARVCTSVCVCVCVCVSHGVCLLPSLAV